MTTWKLDETGAIVMKDGDPVFVDAAGREMVVSHDTIKNLNAEAKNLRLNKEQFEAKLKEYEGIDAVAARKALETVGKLDAKQLIDSGKVDELKNQITQQFTAQVTEKDGTISKLQSRIDSMMIDSIFSNSDFIQNSIAIPSDIFKDSFSKYFKAEDGQVVAYDKSGNRLLSKSKAGEYATPEEALQILIDNHPQKDILLKADVGAGSGSKGGAGSRGAFSRSMTVAEFSKLTPAKQAEVSSKVRSGELPRLTD
jgi:hypothetical protein